jgi:hypothetical protein
MIFDFLVMQWLTFIIVAIVIFAISIICLKYRRGAEKYLCGDCRFNNDADCLKIERPQALVCTSYRAHD